VRLTWSPDFRLPNASVVARLRSIVDVAATRSTTQPTSGRSAPNRETDPESGRWLTILREDEPGRDQGIAELYAMLLRAARAEVSRRADRFTISGPEADDLAHHAAADAALAILAKLATFRGESRFSTWAYRFVILEVSTKIGRHVWQRPTVALDREQWERLPERFGIDPSVHAQARDLLTALRRAIEEDLTPHQRRVFVAIVLNAVPLDAVALELGSNRNAIYKTMFDARGKLRAALAANGYLTNTADADSHEEGRR
jgi:RNA polymerase sigma-70 factor (ECF subfamily)